MRERVAAIGGTMSFDGGVGRGTRLLVRVPCAHEAADAIEARARAS
jgi:glucose-6-phosphate-specific signal transduction histidine kinase